MTKENGRRSFGEIFGDSIFPGLGSPRGWDMDKMRRQTEALERIAKGYKERRIVQEIARKESPLPEKNVYDLQSVYNPQDILQGFENLKTVGEGTKWAIEDNTEMVKKSTELLSKGLSGIEKQVMEMVGAAYQIDDHLHDNNVLLSEGNNLLGNINNSVEEVADVIEDQTYILKNSLNGVSTPRKNLIELGNLLNGEEEMVALALKGVLDKKESKKFFRSLGNRKQKLIEQVVNFDPEFHESLQDEEKEYLQNLVFRLNAPLNEKSLGVLARHGYLDRFVQDELGENIREVRTDVYGMNQSAREILEIMDEQRMNDRQHLKNEAAFLENQQKGLNLQEEIKWNVVSQNIKLGAIEKGMSIQIGLNADLLKAQIVNNETQYQSLIQQQKIKKILVASQNLQKEQLKQQFIGNVLQYEALAQLGVIEDVLYAGFSEIKESITQSQKIQEVVAWTGKNILKSLNSLNEKLENSLSLRSDERLRTQVVSLMKAGKYDIALKALSAAEKDDYADPRNYFFKGISHLYLNHTEEAEENLKTALDINIAIGEERTTKEVVDETSSQIMSFLGQLYFKLAQQEGGNFDENIQKAIEVVQERYKKSPSLAAGVDLIKYVTVRGDLSKAYKVIKEVFRLFPEVVVVLLEDETFLPFQEKILKDKWTELYQLRARMLKKFNK